MSDFWKAGIKLRFNASEHEENINFEQVLDPKGYNNNNNNNNRGVGSNFGVVRPERNELPAGGSGGAGKPQRVQGGVLVRVQGAKPPKAPRIPHFRTSDMLLSWRKNLVFLLNKNI